VFPWVTVLGDLTESRQTVGSLMRTSCPARQTGQKIGPKSSSKIIKLQMSIKIGKVTVSKCELVKFLIRVNSTHFNGKFQKMLFVKMQIHKVKN
jgi:hypothetical protein